ncbi:MAG: ATP-binding cassette domain-containing protein [Thermodesulfobacteriota bacterium]
MSLPLPCPDSPAEKSGLQASELGYLANGPYSFSIPRGRCIGLTGPSGIGKSQLLRAVADLIPFTGGLFYDGKPSSDWTGPQWRRLVCMVPAEPAWWYDQVGDHFDVPFDSHPFCHWLERLGFSMDSLQWRVTRLSTGEKQRFSLLRSLVRRPPILLLDEPTSGLNIDFSKEVESLILEEVAAGCGVLWISHDTEQLGRVCDNSYILDHDGLTELQVEEQP